MNLLKSGMVTVILFSTQAYASRTLPTLDCHVVEVTGGIMDLGTYIQPRIGDMIRLDANEAEIKELRFNDGQIGDPYIPFLSPLKRLTDDEVRNVRFVSQSNELAGVKRLIEVVVLDIKETNPHSATVRLTKRHRWEDQPNWKTGSLVMECASGV